MLLSASDVIKIFFTSENGERLMSQQKLYKMANSGTIPALKIEGRWLFNKEALKRWASCEEFFQTHKEKKFRPITRIEE